MVGQAVGDEVRLTVCDNRPGIPRAELEETFHRFRRLSTAEGLGLGLAIMRSIVEMHAGRVWAENGEGGRARFHIALPGS